MYVKTELIVYNLAKTADRAENFLYGIGHGSAQSLNNWGRKLTDESTAGFRGPFDNGFSQN